MDNHNEPAESIAIELANLDRLETELIELLSEMDEDNLSFEVRAAGSILHDFYCGAEKIFKRIAVTIDKDLPAGMNWHTDLLLRMGIPVDSVRGVVLSKSTINRLKEFLRFRHLFRHIYGFELKWERVEPLCLEVGKVLNVLKKEVNGFLEQFQRR